MVSRGRIHVSPSDYPQLTHYYYYHYYYYYYYHHYDYHHHLSPGNPLVLSAL